MRGAWHQPPSPKNTGKQNVLEMEQASWVPGVWYTHTVPEMGMLRQEDLKFEASLGYLVRFLSYYEK